MNRPEFQAIRGSLEAVPGPRRCGVPVYRWRLACTYCGRELEQDDHGKASAQMQRHLDDHDAGRGRLVLIAGGAK